MTFQILRGFTSMLILCRSLPVWLSMLQPEFKNRFGLLSEHPASSSRFRGTYRN